MPPTTFPKTSWLKSCAFYRISREKWGYLLNFVFRIVFFSEIFKETYENHKFEISCYENLYGGPIDDDYNEKMQENGEEENILSNALKKHGFSFIENLNLGFRGRQDLI